MLYGFNAILPPIDISNLSDELSNELKWQLNSFFMARKRYHLMLINDS